MFQDVKATDWYADAIAAGKAYQLVGGVDANMFNPTATISRQEAMVILANAMTVTKIDTEITQTEVTERLSGFMDKELFANWAKEAAALNQKYGIVQGSAGLTRPKDHLTRAEAAAIISRLLEQADLK